MHVVYLNPTAAIGGAERVLLSMLRVAPLRLSDFTATLVVPEDGPLISEATKLGAKCVVLPWPSAVSRFGDTQLRGAGRFAKVFRLVSTGLRVGPGMVGYLRRLRTLLKQEKPDIVHSHGLKGHLPAALVRGRGVAVVWQLHDYYHERPMVGKLLRPVRHRVALAIADSESVKKETLAVLPGVRIEALRNAVDTDHFTPGDAIGTELDRLAGLPIRQGALRVGLVATYANWKGQGTFLEALALVLPKFPEARGFIVGGPIYKTTGSQWTLEELKAKADALGIADQVGFVPFQADPRDIYRMLDIVVHASIRPEPLGLTIAEAMSCGRAVVVSAAGGAAELFTEGVDGLGHEPGNVSQLASCIERLLSDTTLRQRLGNLATKRAQAEFGLVPYGDKLKELYQSLSSASV